MQMLLKAPISGRHPCQVEGIIVETNEPFYFRQRGFSASLTIYDKPLGASLDRGEIPVQQASYKIQVEPLTCDAEDCLDEVTATMLSLLSMHEQARANHTGQQQ